MAEIQELDDSGSDIGEFETVEEQIEDKPTEQAAPDLPEKYRGKSVADVVKMHQEAEKLVGRTMNEVSEVRKLADELIKSQLTPKPQADKPKEVDFFENPQEAIRQQIESNPRVIAAEQYAKQVQAEQSKQRLAQLHPDITQVIGDEGFKTWVKASRVRQQLFHQADNYDLEAADELISTYKELRSVRQKQVEAVDNTVRDKTLKAVSVDTGGSGESSKKIFRRADLIRLRMSDPEKYESRMPEIMAAYAEGRVK